MTKRNHSARGVVAAVALIFAGLLVSGPVRADDPVLKRFNVSGTQYTLLQDFFWHRFGAKAGFSSCVRRFYGAEELLKNPMPADAYGVLSFFKKAMANDRKNTFAFLNSRGEPWKCKLVGGYCMGLTVLERDLNLLLVFDPNQSRSTLPKFASDQEKSEYFEKILWEVLTLKKPAFVPGFSDLYAFSSDPVIKNIFMGAVPWNWADLATIPKIAIGVLAKSRRLVKEEEMIAQMTSLLESRKRGYNASLYLGGIEGRSARGGKAVKARAMAMLESVEAHPEIRNLDRAPTERELVKALGPEMMAKLQAELEPELLEALELGRRKFGSALESAPQPKMAMTRTIGDAVDGALDSQNAYIHVVQVSEIKELGPRKWEISTIDPNAYAPHNVGTLKVDLDGTPKIYWEGASASLELNSFGQLPGDVEHLDEIVANLILFEKEHPGLFVETPKPPATRKPRSPKPDKPKKKKPKPLPSVRPPRFRPTGN